MLKIRVAAGVIDQGTFVLGAIVGTAEIGVIPDLIGDNRIKEWYEPNVSVRENDGH
jgi:hypothetical protein